MPVIYEKIKTTLIFMTWRLGERASELMFNEL